MGIDDWQDRGFFSILGNTRGNQIVLFKNDPWYDEMTSSDFNYLKGPQNNAMRYEYGRKIYFVYPEEY